MPQAQVLGRGSSGIATLATVLADKNADCHTPPAVLVRGGSTMQRMGVVSRAAVGTQITWSVCRSASLILTSILYHKGNDLSIVFGKFFSTDLDVIRLNTYKDYPSRLGTGGQPSARGWMVARIHHPTRSAVTPTGTPLSRVCRSAVVVVMVLCG